MMKSELQTMRVVVISGCIGMVLVTILAVAYDLPRPIRAELNPPKPRPMTSELWDYWVFHWHEGETPVFITRHGPFQSRDNAEQLMIKLAPERTGLAARHIDRLGKVTLHCQTDYDLTPWTPPPPPIEAEANP